MPLDITAAGQRQSTACGGAWCAIGSEPADDQLRDGLIQRFEFTYELCHRMLRRFIRQTAASPEEVDRMAFQDLIRTANQQGLLLGTGPPGTAIGTCGPGPATPIRPRQRRQVAAAIPGFLAEAEYLRDELRKRLA